MKFGSKELNEVLRTYLFAQTSILKNVVKKRINNKSDKIKVLLASSCNTATAICLLGNENEYFYNEMIILSRGYIEKLINYCYLTVCDEKEYQNYIKHSIQKSYRKLDRSIKVGNHKISVSYSGKEAIKTDRILEALNEFTSQHGKEITHWTKMSIEERLNVISEKTKINIGIFMLNTLSIYEDASESLHGTLYGASFHTWKYQPNIKSLEDINKNTFKNSSLLFLQLGSMINEIIAHIGTFIELNDFVSPSIKNTLNATELLKKGMS